ncbi:MAG: helix-turn-helix transcriptional regulator [Phycisphaerales bacterium]|nr:helix-turn-helix transcriptional regulator [Phycisphaerales bacterium]MBT7170169.1 helix-turn-helix transcriptional regulator [Phycisphaerales bacterium]
MLLDGQKIRTLRKSAGYDRQQDLADSLGVSRQTIIRLEKGESKACGLSTLRRLAGLLGVKRDTLYREEDPVPQPCNPQEQELLEAFRKLPTKHRAYLLLQAMALADDPNSLNLPKALFQGKSSKDGK